MLPSMIFHIAAIIFDE